MIKFYYDYDGFMTYKCPKCGNFNIKINENNFHCLDCGKNSFINVLSSNIMEGLKNVQNFIISI